MNNSCKWQFIYFAIFLSTAFVTQAYGHGDGGGSNSKDLVRVSFAPNPSVPEFANVTGTLAVDLDEGVIKLEDLEGFPINPAKNLPLTINITSTIDPRSKRHDGELGKTSCEENNGTWTCHVHSYVVWLAGFEDGALGHVIPLGTIYPRTDGSAADRDFSGREGNMSGLGADTIIITAEPSFGPLASMGHGHDGEVAILLVPLGPIVLQATIP